MMLLGTRPQSRCGALRAQQAALRPDHARHHHRRRRGHHHGGDRRAARSAASPSRSRSPRHEPARSSCRAPSTAGGVRIGDGSRRTLTEDDADGDRARGAAGAGSRRRSIARQRPGRRAATATGPPSSTAPTPDYFDGPRLAAGLRAAVLRRARTHGAGQGRAARPDGRASSLFGEADPVGQTVRISERAVHGRRRARPQGASRPSGRTRTTSSSCRCTTRASAGCIGSAARSTARGRLHHRQGGAGRRHARGAERRSTQLLRQRHRCSRRPGRRLLRCATWPTSRRRSRTPPRRRCALLLAAIAVGLAARRRHRHHEHHARLGHRADARDRHPHGRSAPGGATSWRSS